MGRLLIWTTSKAAVLSEALSPAFERIDEVPDNETIPLEEGVTVIPGVGDVCLVMGTKCLKALQAMKLVHGGRAISSLRQSVVVSPKGGYYLFTLDPFTVRTQADAPSMIRQDVALACRLAVTGSVDPQLGEYRIVEDLSDLVIEVDRRLSLSEDTYVELAGDTETLGLYPEAEGAKLVTVQFTIDPGKADVLFFDDDGTISQFNADAIEYLLTHPRILLVGANWKYDSRWIRRHLKIRCTNLSRDTMLTGSMVDENRSNSLKTHAWEYTAMGGYDRLEEMGYDKGRMDLVPRHILKDYAGADTDVTLQSSRKIKSEMEAHPKLVRLYRKVVMPASLAFEDMEHEGVAVDLPKFSQLSHDLADEIGALEEQLIGLMPARLKAKYADKIADQLASGKSPLVPALIKDYFFTPYGLNLKPLMVTEKTSEPSTAKNHLMMFADNEAAKAFVDVLSQHGSASKAKSTFVDGFLKHLRADGRLHPSYMMFVGSMFGEDDDDAGAVTGRTSCKDPAFQCAVGETLVTTDRGLVRLDRIVADGGRGCKVLTHTGAWRDVVGVYRNGVRPVYRVTTSSGASIICTDNHPLLTDRGFVETKHLSKGGIVFTSGSYEENSRAQIREERRPDADLQVLVGHEDPMPQFQFDDVQPLRRSRHFGLRPLDEVREFSGGHGRGPEGHDAGTKEPRRGLRAEQLLLAPEGEAEPEQAQQPPDHMAGRYAMRGGVGPSSWLGSEAAAQAAKRLECGEGHDDAVAAYEARFRVEEIVSIEYVGERETFDLTIDRCHSFIGDGLVVHNTIPKKTKWAKRIRECYPAPPGRLMVAFDFSQGELKVVACIANEANMLRAFREGLDLHCVTAAAFMGVSYEEFRALELSDPFLYTLMRTAAKAGNFGLLYGMQVNGFRKFARFNYGVDMSQSETEQRRDLFFERYPGLLDYHEDMEKYARKHGFVESPLGRIRHLPLIDSPDQKSRSDAIRQGINAPVQSTLNDLTFYALGGMRRELPRLSLCGMVHDQIIGYVDEDIAHETAHMAKQVMDNLPIRKELGWDHQIPFTSDGEIGINMAALQKL